MESLAEIDEAERTAGTDLVGALAAGITVMRVDDDGLEVRDLNLLDVAHDRRLHRVMDEDKGHSNTVQLGQLSGIDMTSSGSTGASAL